MNESIIKPLLDKGTFPVLFSGLILILSGIFVITQSGTGYFLPHDVNYLGLTAQELSQYKDGLITKFMFHDRVAYGGSIISVGIIYMWLGYYPLKNGAKWAWWLLLGSATIGFGSYLSYLGRGYLDTWHGISTLLLFPVFIIGLIKSKNNIRVGSIDYSYKLKVNSIAEVGHFFLLLTSIGILLAGLTILSLGSTLVFVPTDLEFMNINICGLNNISPKLIPLIAHDRANFGGGLATTGLMLTVIIMKQPLNKNLWECLLLSMGIGFIFAIGIHFVVGYYSFKHLLPAYIGYIFYIIGITLSTSKIKSI